MAVGESGRKQGLLGKTPIWAGDPDGSIQESEPQGPWRKPFQNFWIGQPLAELGGR